MPLPRLDPFALAGAVTRSAVSNARAAAALISEQVEDRRQLAPLEEPAGPGTISRLGRPECLALLESRRVGRLAYIARQGVPDIVPVNYALHDGALLIRSGVGPKLQAAERREVMTLEVDDLDEDAQTGWSVVAAGPAQRLTATEVEALPATALPRAWAVGPRSAVLRIRPTRLEGRLLS